MERETLGDGEFFGRARELAVLEAAHRKPSGFVPIYGRRRIGKSELILRFLHGKRGIYHVGKIAPPALQIREFLEQAARTLEDPLLARIETSDWREAITSVVDRAKGKKLVLAFDEFQWTAEASPELPSVLQELWDRRWSRGGVLLILCGSFIGFMEREVLGQKSPLFGRRTAQIHLAPFNFREASAFHPRWSRVDRARAYFLVGGVPAYLRALDPSRSIEQNIATELLSEFAPLHREPEFLLREELRDVANYHAVLYAVATGSVTTRTIAERTAIPERSLPYYLEQLVQLGYVARRHPLTGQKPNARVLRFVLEDPLLRFWFRFVFANKSEISRLGPDAAMRTLVKPQLDAYCGGGFERMCREALPMLYADEGVSGPATVGEYWDKSTQIDVVGVRDDGFVDLGECKWGAVRSTNAVVADLDRKVSAFPNPKNATIARRIFVRDRPRARAAAGLTVHSLAELYGEK